MGRDAHTIQLPGAHVEGIAPVEELQVVLQQDKAPLHPLQMHCRVLWKKGSITSWGGHTAPLFDPVLVSQKSPLFDPVLVSQKSPLFDPVLVSQKSPLFDPVLVSQKSPLFDPVLVSQKSPLFDPVLVSQKSPLFDPVLVSQYFNQSLLVTNLHYLNQTSTLLTKQASHKSLLFQAALVSPLL